MGRPLAILLLFLAAIALASAIYLFFAQPWGMGREPAHQFIALAGEPFSGEAAAH